MQKVNNDSLNYVTSISALSGFILYHIRNQMGLNQREIASIFDITHTTYGNMERGDTAINSDFIYMLCTLIGVKFSDYFKLVEDLIIEVEKIEQALNGEKIKIQIIPSSDLQKIIMENAKNGFSIAPSTENLKNLLIGQDINFFISKELKERLSVISQIRLTKEQINGMINLKSNEVEEAIQFIKNVDSESPVLVAGTTVGSLSGVALTNASLAAFGGGALAAGGGMAAGTIGAATLTTLIVAATAFPLTSAIAGYSLYKAYKQTKEDKKLKK
ncbi:hypothetical protein B9T23_16290 [Acinetobacter terrae]|uniref:helix-turn-helix domain-containing protein n=1 Tax=Acinetobacter terrae TaxID=2731247 RepID=UPI000A338F5A|nr:helix-turn-helix transcriptional regulator [Acinetobacter terrae]OTG70481.1 hypothetical protein B9T23_16290 [Acinetobacter terrae]